MWNKITFLCLILTVLSCKNSDSDLSEKEKIKASSWLLGKWESKTNSGTLSETWKKVNDSTFEGHSYFIKEKDTLHFETIILQQKGEELTYSTTIIGQNETKPFVFPAIENSEVQLVLENAKYDYPQKINYKLIAPDSLSTDISGIQLGNPSSEHYLLKKLK